MVQRPPKSISIRQSWRPQDTTLLKAIRLRFLWRFALTALLIGVAAVWIHMLMSPLFHPTTRLYFITAGDYEGSNIAPIPFFRNDAAQLLASQGNLDEALLKERFLVLSNANESTSILRSIQRNASSNDLLVLYLSAHATVIDDAPVLLPRNVDSWNALTGTIPLREYLTELSQINASHIVLLLDTGYELPKEGPDRFVSEAQKVLLQLGSSKVSIISSRNEGQRAYASWKCRSSIFARVVSGALAGIADANQDRVIQMGEFFDCVERATEQWVQTESAGKAVQTPVWLGSESQIELLRDSTLSSVANTHGAEQYNDVATLLREANGMEPETELLPPTTTPSYTSDANEWLSNLLSTKQARIQDNTKEQFVENLDFLPDFVADRIKNSLSLNEEEEEGTSAKPSMPEKKEEPTQPSEASSVRTPSWSRLGSADKNLLVLVDLIWEYCALFEEASEHLDRPVDLTPHGWENLLGHIHSIESQIRCDSVSDEAATKFELYSILISLHQWYTEGVPLMEGSVRELWKSQPRLSNPQISPPTIALLQRYAKLTNRPLENALDQKYQQLLASLRADSNEAFVKWSEQVVEDDLQYLEFWIATQLRAKSDSQWNLVRDTLQFYLDLQTINAQLEVCHPEVMDHVAKASQLWLESYRWLLDKSSSQALSKTRGLLTSANVHLQSAKDGNRLWIHVLQHRNTAMSRVPALIRWNQIARDRLGDYATESNIIQYLNELQKLQSAILRFDRISLQEIAQIDEQQRMIWKILESDWNTKIDGVLEPSDELVSNRGWIYDSLLSTSLFHNSSRSRLLSFDAKQFEGTWTSDQVQTAISSSTLLQSTPKVRDSLSIAIKALQDVDLTSEDSSPPVLKEEPQQVDSQTMKDIAASQLALMVQEHRGRFEVSASPSAMVDGISEQKRLQAIRNLYAIWDQIRIGREDAPPRERMLFQNGLERLASLINLWSRSTWLTNNRYRAIAASGTQELDLTANTMAKGEIVWINRGQDLPNGWLLVDFDPTQLAVDLSPSIPILKIGSADPSRLWQRMELPDSDSSLAQDITAKATARSGYPHINSSSLTIPITLSAGQEFRIPFQARRLESVVAESKISWKFFDGQSLYRWDTRVDLPQTDFPVLFVDSLRSSNALTSQTILELLPNRAVDVRFGLRKRSNKPQSIQVQLLALEQVLSDALPEGVLEEPVAAEALLKLGRFQQIGKTISVSLPEGSSERWLHSLELEKPDAAPPGIPPAQPPPKIPPIPAHYGMIARMVDSETKQTVFQKIMPRIVHPRGYVSALADYDALSGSLTIRVESTDPSAIPPQGVDIQARFEPDLPRGTEMKLRGQLMPNGSLQLYANLPSFAANELLLVLDVDGYPRALQFQIQRWKSSHAVAPMNQSLQLQILPPEVSNVLGKNSPSPTIKLRADGYLGSFLRSTDFIEIGWDIDQDREFRQEQTWKFYSDRSSEVFITPNPTGSYTFESKVRDLELQIPAPGTRNGRVNLLARMMAAGDMIWSEPQEWIVDETPPAIKAVQLTPTRIVASNETIAVAVSTEDFGLSGVASVQVALDPEGVSQWHEGLTGVPLTKNSQGYWVGKVAAAGQEPGFTSLICMATDMAGNRSALVRSPIEIIDAAELAARDALKTFEIAGFVTYSNASVPNAKMTLLDGEGKVVSEIRTDARGFYRFVQVKQGKFKVHAIGVIKNKPRKATKQLELTPASKTNIIENFTLE